MRNIVYVHGLGCTHRSFNYIIQNLPEHRSVLINYDSHQPLEQSIQQVARQIPHFPSGETFSIVGHSLGGLISTYIALTSPRIDSLMTIASPLAGSATAAAMRWFPGAPAIWHDITPTSEYIRDIGNLILKRPTLSLIATEGASTLINEPNDGVLTVASQSALAFGKKVVVKANHFEILAHEKTVKLMKGFLFEKEPIHEEKNHPNTAEAAGLH